MNKVTLKMLADASSRDVFIKVAKRLLAQGEEE